MALALAETPSDVEQFSAVSQPEGDADQSSVVSLVLAARQRQTAAWASIFRRYEPLVRSVIRSYRFPPAETEDIIQEVWLRLVESIDQLREPQAFPRWIAVITANQCRREVKSLHRTVAVDPLDGDHAGQPGGVLETVADQDRPDEVVLRDEARRAIRNGLAELSPDQQKLLVLVTADPPLPYAEIGKRLGMPVGSIGPSRARCLKKLRETNAVRDLVEASGARA